MVGTLGCRREPLKIKAYVDGIIEGLTATVILVAYSSISHL